MVLAWVVMTSFVRFRLSPGINSTLDLNLYGWVGDPPHMLDIVLYCDADLAGDRTDSKSTSGMFMCLLGPRTFMPLNAMSKKQTSVSKSTPEAEIVSLDHAIYKHGLPALDLWECVMNRKFSLHVMEDNEAAIRVIVTGHNPNMRHMSRTQRIDISALNDRYHAEDFRFVTCPSEFEAGDILTKACADAKVWTCNLMSIGHFRKGTLIDLGILTAVPAVSRALTAQRPGARPTMGVHFERGATSFNHIAHQCHAEGISLVQVSAYPNPKVTVVLSGDTFFLDKTDVRVIYVNSMSTSRGTTFLSDRIAASPMIYLSLVPVAGGSLSTITGNDRKGWKGTRDMLRSALAESREAMIFANHVAKSSVPFAPLWPRDELKEWSASHRIDPVKVCSCFVAADGEHAWMCAIFMSHGLQEILHPFLMCKK